MRILLASLLLISLQSNAAEADVMAFEYDTLGFAGSFTGIPASSAGQITNLGTEAMPIPILFLGENRFDLSITLNNDILSVVYDYVTPFNPTGVAPGVGFTLQLSNFDVDGTLTGINYLGDINAGTVDPVNVTIAGDTDPGTALLTIAGPGTQAPDGGGIVRADFEFVFAPVTAVPEPSSFAVCFIGGLAAWRIRRKRAA